jgi:hypothetical protein
VRASEPTYDTDINPLRSNDSDGSTSVRALVQYFQAEDDSSNEKPYVSKIPPPLRFQPINFTGKFQATIINDVRPHEAKFELNVQGFAFKKHVLRSLKSNITHDNIRSNYLPGMAGWLKSTTRANEVFIFDYEIS